MIRILGLDPGSRITGFGLIEKNCQQLRYLASGCIRLGKLDLALRLKKIYESVKEILTDYQPTDAAIEQVFVHKNNRSALTLGHARGAAMVAVSMNHLSIAEYAPRKIKQVVVGYGGAEKEQVQKMVQMLLQLDGLPQADAADALAVAICHASTMGEKA